MPCTVPACIAHAETYFGKQRPIDNLQHGWLQSEHIAICTWFMPALANSSVGSLCGTTLLDGTTVWPFVAKKSRNACRTRSPARIQTLLCTASKREAAAHAEGWTSVVCALLPDLC